MVERAATPPERVRVPTMRQRWEDVAFLHWSYPLDVVAPHLPPGLELDPWDGRVWVGLVVFRMHVHPPFGPRLEVVPPFPESNVRTYVRGPGGRPGIWFFSLDAGSASAVAAARATYSLPYFHADMSIERTGGTLRYRSRRRTPGPVGVGHDVELVAGEALEPSEFDNYLTARFTLWNRNRGVLLRTQADHPPWSLRSAAVHRSEQDLLQTGGLPAPEGEPIAHFADGVDVRIAPPRPHLT